MKESSRHRAEEALDETVRQIEDSLRIAADDDNQQHVNHRQNQQHQQNNNPQHHPHSIPSSNNNGTSSHPAYGTVDRKSLKSAAKVSSTLSNQVSRSTLENHLQKGIHQPGGSMGSLNASTAALGGGTSTAAAARLPPPMMAGPIQSMRLGLGLVVPINDLKGVTYTDKECMARCKLASLYRLVDLNGWSQAIYNHITFRLEESKFLINPFGLLYHEVSASKLLTLDSTTERIIDPGTSAFGFNRAGWTIHAAVHSFRPDANCVIHIHTPEIVACSINPNMLTLPLCQEACILGPVGVHKYSGIVLDKEEMKEIQKDLGKQAKILLLENHGALVLGSTVEEAWHYLYHLMIAAKTQVMIHSTNLKGSWLEQKAARVAKLSKKTHDVVVEGDVGSEGKMEVGVLNFEAQMRSLDDLGYRTGYPYHQTSLRPTTYQQRLALEAHLAQALAEQKYKNDMIHTTARPKTSQNSTSTPQLWAVSPNRYEKRPVGQTKSAASIHSNSSQRMNESQHPPQHQQYNARKLSEPTSHTSKSSHTKLDEVSSRNFNESVIHENDDDAVAEVNSVCSDQKNKDGESSTWELMNAPERQVQTSQGPIKLPANSLIPTGTNRSDAARAYQVVKSIEEQTKRQNYVVEKTNHFNPKPTVPDRNNPFLLQNPK